MLRISLQFVLLLALPLVAQADVFVRGDVRLSAAETYGHYDLMVDVPDAVDTAGELGLPAECAVQETQRYATDAGTRVAWFIVCSRHLTPEDRVVLPFEMDAASIAVSDDSGTTEFTLAGISPFAFGVQAPLASSRGFFVVAGEYLRQGILHIAVGWDHLAFVLCLCLLTARLRSLLGLITAFTIGHSVSMALSFFDVVRVAIPPMEAVIALSIVWMAREAKLARREPNTSNSFVRQMVIVVGFGLLHGLGFASALQQLGVPALERTAALAFFNVGVELGQIVFVLVVTALMTLARRVSVERQLATSALTVTGAVGVFWVLERVSGFTPI
ncbi:MAG: HupE/UreJ family protein [Pseudomonadota bacterium]